jgi:DNA-binding transcriptional MerR regulator
MPPAEPVISEKLYFKIGEVSHLVGVAPYVLRFWETEFKQIKPRRTPTGQRLYRKKDVETFLKIKHFLYEKNFTIKGARKKLGLMNALKPTPELGTFLEECRKELLDIRDILADNTRPKRRG